MVVFVVNMQLSKIRHQKPGQIMNQLKQKTMANKNTW